MGDYMHSENEVVYLYLDDIIPNRFQPRELFDERSLKELAVSIKEHGVIQPIIVRRNGEKYEIIAGERRYKASAKAGLTKIPAIIRDLDDKESSKVALLENLQRKNLNPIEEAKTYQKVLEIDQMTQEELAKTMGKSQSAVANKLRLLSLSEGVQNALLNAKISERHARTLLSVPDKEEQEKLVKKVIQERITVRELERLIKHGQHMNEEMNKTRPDEEERQEEKSQEFKFDSFENPDPEEKHHVPPKPDTLIDFDDVTKELEHNNKIDKENDRDDSYKPQLIDEAKNEDKLDNDFLDIEKPKFINYGEIDPDLDNDDDDDDSSQKNFEFTSTPREDNDLSESNRFFSTEENLPNSDNDNGPSVSSLDSLLNIRPPKMSPKEEMDENDSFDVSEDSDDYDDSFDEEDLENYKEPEKDEKADQEEKEPDFAHFDETLFKTPTIEEFERKNKSGGVSSDYLKATSYRDALKEDAYPELKEDKEEANRKRAVNYDVQAGINTIRDTVRSLEKNNLKIDTEEMNFENSYQIVIKIQKPQVEEEND